MKIEPANPKMELVNQPISSAKAKKPKGAALAY